MPEISTLDQNSGKFHASSNTFPGFMPVSSFYPQHFWTNQAIYLSMFVIKIDSLTTRLNKNST